MRAISDLCFLPNPIRKDEREVEVTREKLGSLEARYQAVSQNPRDDAHIQELPLRSLRRLINQMKEEIARFEGAPELARRPALRSGQQALTTRDRNRLTSSTN